MADADEDLIPSLSSSSKISTQTKDDEDHNDHDNDSDSDTAPDYRLLQPSTTPSTSRKSNSLPSRGTKDFEPLPSDPKGRQEESLVKSRTAMHDALSITRVHAGRKHAHEMVGVYFSDPAHWDAGVFEEAALAKVEDVEKREKMRAATAWGGEGRSVVVEKFTSTFSRTMGRTDRRNWTWLRGEEALFLLERGSLDVRYAVEGEDDEEAEDDEPTLRIGEVPMSLQGAYAAFIGKGGLTLEKYLVYANLRRGGYIVQRAPTWDGMVDQCEAVEDVQGSGQDVTTGTKAMSTTPISLAYRLIHWLFPVQPKPSRIPCHNSVVGPLISPGLFRNYWDIFRQIQLIPQYEYSTIPVPQQPPDSASTLYAPTSEDALYPSWHVLKPSASTSYKKSHPPPPHYRIVVLSARTTTLPTSRQLGDLLASLPDDSSQPDLQKKRLEYRIKHGKKSVLLAVVDCGLVSYLRFSGGGFGEGKNLLWEENERRSLSAKGRGGGGKRGGFRGRGRGRGGQGRGRGG